MIKLSIVSVLISYVHAVFAISVKISFHSELIEQLIHFPLAAHDDGPDALAGAVSLLLAASKPPRPLLIPRIR